MALKNIYQVVAQQLLNSRQCYVNRHHNHPCIKSPIQTGDLILIKNHTAKSFEPLYKGNYSVIKVHGNNVEIRDYRGNLSMVHITDVKKITPTEQIADQYEELGKQGRFSKKCIPKGYIPDFDWTTIHDNPGQSVQPTTEDNVARQATSPIKIDGPPNSRLRSKTSKQSIARGQGQPEHNLDLLEPPERNQAKIHVNTVEIRPKLPSLTQLTKTLLWTKRITKHKAPIATRCTLMITLALHKLTIKTNPM